MDLNSKTGSTNTDTTTVVDDTMLIKELDTTNYNRMVDNYLNSNNTNTPSASFLEDTDFQSDTEAGITQEEIISGGDGILDEIVSKTNMIKVNEGGERLYDDIRRKFQAANCNTSNSGSIKHTYAPTSTTIGSVPGITATNYNTRDSGSNLNQVFPTPELN